MRYLLFAILVVTTACATHTGLEPLGKGQVHGHASIGGPIVAAFDTHIAIPYLTAGADVGMGEQWNVSGRLHILPIAYGIVGGEVGATWFPLHRPEGLTIGLDGRLLAFTNVKPEAEGRFMAYPVVTTTAQHPLGRGDAYAGLNLAIPTPAPDFDPDAALVIASPFIGYRFPVSARWAVQAEVKWHGLNIDTQTTAVDYTNPGGNGAITPLIGFSRRF
jgi:hypothetical protein